MERIDFSELKNSNRSFVIAEIGHNHQGSLETARKMFLEAKAAGADAVKLQKRDNRSLFTSELFDQVYDNPNSYGKTYGEHRELLEFGREEYLNLKQYAKKIGILFFSTPFDFNSVDFLANINMPAYKIASADLFNTPLQRKIAEIGKPIFLSTGGGTMDDICRACDNILSINKQLAVLHCTAAYPVAPEDMNLNVIKRLKQEYPDLVIGLSDHENGIDAASIAFLLGARIFEKHFTLNRAWKGTDQAFSLEPKGLKKLIRNLNRIPHMMGDGIKKLEKSEQGPLRKMIKSIVAASDLPKGTVLKSRHLAYKCPQGGLQPWEYEKILGKKLQTDIKKDQMILWDILK